MKRIFFACLLFLATAILFAFTPRKITGTVLDEKGSPISGASVLIKGTKNGVATGADGGFSLMVNDEKPVLVISAVGFLSQEIKIEKETKFTVRLVAAMLISTDSAQLKEIVVTGYSAETRARVLVDGKRYFGDKGLVAANGAMISGGLAPGAQPNINSLGSLHNLAVTGNIQGGTFAGTLSPGALQNIPGFHNPYYNGEGYEHITENPFLPVHDNPLSTFSIDVDAASYSNIRRMLHNGYLPPEGAVRIEEMINYFHYEYAPPTGKDPFSVHTEMAVCPWNTEHQLVLIGLQGKKMDVADLPPSNLTFLIDVSGSMFSPDKLPLVQASLKLLVDQLRAVDKVAIVAYAGNAGLVLPSTEGDKKTLIKEAIDRLEAGGSTAGGAGIQLAYKIARENFNSEGNNRVILCTDGDFNVGVSSDDALERLIEQERKSGVFLTVLGFGTGNYQDAKMQKLADKGNGNHAYIDQISEAKKVFISEFGGTLYTIAKDVKLQVEFNPKKVKGYRLIGYENRMLAKEDFNNDKKDAGDLGSGHTVTALYELVPIGADMPGVSVDPLRYQQQPVDTLKTVSQFADEVMNVKLRYKQPDGDKSTLMSYPLKESTVTIEQTTDNFRFAAAVASFGMLLRNSEYKGSSSYRFIKALAQKAAGEDSEGYRKEFLQLVDEASAITRRKELVRVGDDVE